MLTLEAAKKIGVDACIDKLGRDFVLTHRDSSTASYTTDADDNGNIFCFVGVDDKPRVHQEKPDVLILDSTSVFPYRVSCNVNLSDGTLQFVECVLPA